MRNNKRKFNELRNLEIIPGFNKYAEGSCLIKLGDTHIICTASVDQRTPSWLRNSNHGWVTAEYSLLPRATHTRNDREVSRGKPSGRTQEIQRLIGRSLRAIVDLTALKGWQVKVDCDVIQADGGTRVTSLCGAYVALDLAFSKMIKERKIKNFPLKDSLAAVSGFINTQGELCLDPDYDEDSSAFSDMNFVISGTGKIIEVQGTAEEAMFTDEEFIELLKMAKQATAQITSIQQKTLITYKNKGNIEIKD